MQENRVALITGGARGIGRALALALAQRGWEVALCYRTSAVEAAEVVSQIQQAGRRGRCDRCDVADPQAAVAWAAAVEREWGRIDALLNCAGPYHRVDLFEETVAGWQEMFAENLHPVFHLSRAVAPGMRARGWGRIVNFTVANVEQLRSQPNVTAYYIAKVGVLILTRTLARMLAPEGITVNAVAPGFIDTGSAPAGELERMAGQIPAGYFGAVDDVVSVCCFLLSEAARYVNGANIQVSGGWGV